MSPTGHTSNWQYGLLLGRESGGWMGAWRTGVVERIFTFMSSNVDLYEHISS